MTDSIVLIVFIALWITLQVWLLPRLGVST